ncbi:hypothetical protein FRC00_006047 [Tulasnella sp. 408]|nr:hypothetical protein FRC00_006047 [Tulasnella sp. 408]
MKEEEVADMRWVGFITVADQRGGHYRPRSSSPTAYGGFSDIWQCDALFFGDLNAVVAVKKLRAVKLPQGLDKSQTSKRLLKRLKRELKIWMRVQHPNIAPLLGFTFDEEIAIISPWFGHGNLSDYLTEHPEANRMSLIQGVAAGLAYLHSSIPLIIHGDIKPDNVLIDQLERPRITDFGLSKIVEEEPSLTSLRSASLRDAGNTRWIAPELLLEEGVSRSKRTDIFSFGCVVFFIFTGDVPFKSIADGQLVISRFGFEYDADGDNALVLGQGSPTPARHWTGRDAEASLSRFRHSQFCEATLETSSSKEAMEVYADILGENL